MDNFSDYPTSLTAPARDGAQVVPDDAQDLAALPRAVYVGQTGHLSAVLVGGQALLFQNVQAGSVLPIRVKRVNQTGTTATNIIALW
jgi:hypothetical protein